MTRRPRLRRVVPFLAAFCALLAGLVAVGRWERGHNAHIQNDRIEAVYRRATSRGLISPLLDYYRLAPAFDCLLYHPPGRPQDFATYELCFDGRGRLVEAFDRRSSAPTIASLAEEPQLASLTVPVPRLCAALRHLGADRDPRLAGGLDNSLPLGIPDSGLARFKTSQDADAGA